MIGGYDSGDLAGLRRDYDGPDLDETNLEADPTAQFRRWFDEALRSGMTEPNAMVLATVDSSGSPRQRTVLLKHVDEAGFVFFTNYESAKAGDLAAHPRASLLFPWLRMHRQVIVSGEATRVPGEETARYFARRPRGAQLAAWASRQSRVVAD
ncbi:MAG: pyridoxine/pyridoxamine 5'-phosphate oxidase, partial [Stackebrandtia sp.]